QRLTRQHGCGIEELLERCRAYDASLLEERIHHGVACGQRAGMRGGGPCPRPRTAGLHGHDRLLLGDAAGDVAEAAWIPEALEVQENHVRSWIIGPVLDEVVARH